MNHVRFFRLRSRKPRCGRALRGSSEGNDKLKSCGATTAPHQNATTPSSKRPVHPAGREAWTPVMLLNVVARLMVLSSGRLAADLFVDAI